MLYAYLIASLYLVLQLSRSCWTIPDRGLPALVHRLCQK